MWAQDGFAYVTGGNPNPGDDLRPYNISSPENFKFILQELGSRRLNASKRLFASKRSHFQIIYDIVYDDIT